MMHPALLVLLPFLGAVVLAAIPRQPVAALANIGFSAGGFLLALALLALPREVEGLLHLDALNLPLLLLSGLVGLTTAVFSAATLPAEGFGPRAGRAYHAAFQLFLGANHLALLADNLGLMWVAIELATLASVLMVALHRTPAAIEAAWKFLMLCGVGIGLALFGTIVLALAAQPLTGGGAASLSIAALGRVAREADPALMTLAFVFLLVGYGTKAGLVPLHSWLPDAHAEGPMAISAVLSGLLLNAALHAILRAKAIVALNPGPLPPGALMVAMGLASLLLAAFALWRRRDARRLFAWSSIEHMGLAAFAFGLGGPAAMAGLLHMLGHSLVKSALFFALGRAIVLKGGQRLAAIGGLNLSHPVLGWTLALAILATAGLPPFSLFASEFLMAQQSVARLPWLALPLGLGLLVAALALLRTLQDLCFGPATADAPGAPPPALGEWAVLAPAQLHLLLALALGMALPAPLAALLAEAARIAG
ncbi:hydrogenase 4 subunit F [Pseudoroseomonas aestuarii]|uniref:Hydrogenase 4 subunit F n=2 Tax=Teichococcus aestuarii TaxID=568898 RepID=A0A2U1V748_9PROT|nr:hydrogenase 4 subunit F [Pseudoroseomonas aestuarii]